ncbi:MAG: hypothetical protein FWD57_12185, partial [Polyangiaceae bacterium]|nr:hypothetical protein [Polyangiaceae bacterium]
MGTLRGWCGALNVRELMNRVAWGLWAFYTHAHLDHFPSLTKEVSVVRKFSILSLGLLALTVAGTAIAGPTGFVVQVPGELRVSQSKPVESAQKVIRKSAGLPDAVELVLARDRTSSGLRMMRFSQVHKGIPVYKRGVALAFDSHGVTRIASSKVEHVLPDSVVPVLDANAAAEVATKTAGLAATASNTRLLIWPTASGGRLAYSVLPPNLLPIPYAPVVIVDAETGDVLSVQNLVRQKNMANMFEVSPREPNSSLPRIQVELPVGEGLDVPDNDLLKSFNCVDKKTTRDVSIMGFNLKIHLCELEKSAVADTVNGDFLQYDYENDTEGGDAFAQVSIFYHSSRAYKFFKGFDPGFELEATSKPLFLVANLMLPDGLMEFDPTRFANPDLPLIPFDNAFSMAGDPQMGAMMSTIWPEITGGALMFGQGYNVDFSYDGSVIYHEFAHSMVGSTIGLVGSWHLDSQGGTCSPGAMNEALADYYAGAISGDDIVGEYAGKGLGLETIRDLKNTKTCPANLTGEVHADSEFFSAPMWATRTALASDDDRFAFDKAIFEALGNASSGDVAFEELAELLVTAVGVPLGEATSNLLRDKFEERGVLPVCQRTWTYTGKAINSND